MSSQGYLEYIVLRPGRNEPPVIVEEAVLVEGYGIDGDRYRKDGKRQVTLIQSEHLEELPVLLGREIPKGATRRNLVTRGIDLLKLKDKQFTVGNVLLLYTGLCPPCSRMDEVLGPGGLKAMANKGGITARVLIGGVIRASDPIQVIDSN